MFLDSLFDQSAHVVRRSRLAFWTVSDVEHPLAKRALRFVIRVGVVSRFSKNERCWSRLNSDFGDLYPLVGKWPDNHCGEINVGKTAYLIYHVRKIGCQQRRNIATRRNTVITHSDEDSSSAGVRHGDNILNQFAPIVLNIETCLEIKLSSLFERKIGCDHD